MIERSHHSAKLGRRKAGYSECERYRYYLIVEWDSAKPALTVCGLNPSTATEKEDDRTIAKMVRLSRRWGYGSLRMVNLFAFRATKPAEMMKADDPIGPEFSEEYMRWFFGSPILCAWGRHGGFKNQGNVMKAVFKVIGLQTFYLKLNGDGSPQHPLYLAEEGLEMTEWL